MLTMLLFVLTAAASPKVVKATSDLPADARSKVTYDAKTKTMKAASGVTFAKVSDGHYAVAGIEVFCMCTESDKTPCTASVKDDKLSCSGGTCCDVGYEPDFPDLPKYR
jgi:hypothetical protein